MAGDVSFLEKLPLELRQKIYDLSLKFYEPIVKLIQSSNKNIKNEDIEDFSQQLQLPIDIMFVNRQTYQECKRSFYVQNTFTHSNYSLKFLKARPDFKQNVRHLAFFWRGQIRDTGHFLQMITFPNLKKLDINLVGAKKGANDFSFTVLDAESYDKHINRNTLYQDEEVDAIKRFCKAHGFDGLVQIRGLECVKLVAHWWTLNEQHRDIVEEFEAFLQRTLTMVKDPSMKVVKPRLPRKLKVVEA